MFAALFQPFFDSVLGECYFNGLAKAQGVKRFQKKGKGTGQERTLERIVIGMKGEIDHRDVKTGAEPFGDLDTVVASSE